MSAHKFVHVWCDWPDCYASVDTHRLTLAEAREMAAGQGWVSAGGIDLCGGREQASDPTDARCLAAGHAAGGHLPVVTAARGVKGRVDVSCSCGWTDPSVYTALRDLAGYRWRQHLPGRPTNAEAPTSASSVEAGTR